ncbi:helix-hairpin-helix domain-containing protein [Plantactinospora sp. B5E13]|uniref:helix-hairpin-helix domain-containing protein n=1 Tax=unclassified Plantactinospora TaxID=2631981 RepID=UPI00325E0939
MAWFVNQSLFIILAAFLLGLLVGWLVWGTRTQSPPPADTASRPATGEHDLPPAAVESTARPATREHSVPPVPAGDPIRMTTDHGVPPSGTDHGVPPATADQDVPTSSTDQDVRTVATDHEARPVAAGVATMTEPAAVPDDDLERIEGIGPKMAAALRAAGIHTFGQLAETDDSTRRAAIEAAGLSFAPSLVTWGRQARLLADGDEDGFAELTLRLVAGRDTEATGHEAAGHETEAGQR